MKKRKVDTELFNEVKPLTDSLGYEIVELNSFYSKGSLNVTLVVYRKEGVSITGCIDIHKVVCPRIEMIKPERDVYLEILSPGIGRKLKSIEELEIFKKEKIKILKYNNSIWFEGIIEDSDNEFLHFIEKDYTEVKKIRFNDIQKVKLV